MSAACVMDNRIRLFKLVSGFVGCIFYLTVSANRIILTVILMNKGEVAVAICSLSKFTIVSVRAIIQTFIRRIFDKKIRLKGLFYLDPTALK
ncbi:hypothetical protein GCM10020370_62730 [Paenibacillus hodogayensis]